MTIEEHIDILAAEFGEFAYDAAGVRHNSAATVRLKLRELVRVAQALDKKPQKGYK